MKKRLIGFFGLGIAMASLGVVLSSCSKSKDPNAQLNAELTVIDTYITDNATDYNQVLFSEMPIGIKSLGQGPMPGTGESVSFYYTIKLFPSGTVVKTDSVINTVIDNITDKGLKSVAIIPSGSVATVFVPSPDAYGSAGNAALGVPSNTTIMYDIYFKSVQKTAAEETQFQKDQDVIQSYLDTVKGPVVKLPNGVWMKTTVPGTGDNPKVYDYVSFTYQGYVLTTHTVFDQSTLTTVPVLNLIEGLRQGLPYMQDGGTATFYIPSLYGYGLNNGTNAPAIPANAPLIFNITLNAINK